MHEDHRLESFRTGAGRAGVATALLLGWAAHAAALSVNTTTNQVGRLTSAGNGLTRRFVEYDRLGRVARSENVLDGASYAGATTFGYPQGSATAGLGTVPRTMTFPEGTTLTNSEVVTYGYDASGAQRTITTARPGQAAQDVVRDIRRNARGDLLSVTYGNGAVRTYVYDDAGDLRLQRLDTVFAGALAQRYRYGYDANGNVTRVDDREVAGQPDLSATYVYDALDQLVAVTADGVTRAYRYDLTGNLIEKEGQVQSYGGAGRGPHALEQARQVAYNYDSNGNVASTSDGLVLTWDAEDMAVKATRGAATLNQKAFVGEALWRKVEGGVSTLYLPSLRIENGQPRKLFGNFAERSPDGSLKFYHPDHLGSSTVVTDSTRVVRRAAYLPFGEPRGAAGGDFTPKYQFNFKELEATGFYDYGARLYNPVTGRWLSPDSDPLDGPNRYTYAGNNPVSHVDPDGHQKKKPTAAPASATDDDGIPWDIKDGMREYQEQKAREARFYRDFNQTVDFIGLACLYCVGAGLQMYGGIPGLIGTLGTAYLDNKVNPPQPGEFQPPLIIAGTGKGRFFSWAFPRLSRTGVIGRTEYREGTGHQMNSKVLDESGKKIPGSKEKINSRFATEHEKVYGNPQGTGATHTERRRLFDKWYTVKEGQTLVLTGQIPPCPKCQYLMKQFAVWNKATVRYQYRNGQSFVYEQRPDGSMIWATRKDLHSMPDTR